jgi:hypothetical protein
MRRFAFMLFVAFMPLMTFAQEQLPEESQVQEMARPTPTAAEKAAMVGTPPPPQREIMYYRSPIGLMGVDAFRPESTMTLPDRSWFALELRWDTPGNDPDPAKNNGVVVRTMTGIQYERYRLLQRMPVGESVRDADTGIHALSYRRYFFIPLGQRRIQVGIGANFGLAWEFSTYTERDAAGSYVDFRRVNRMMAYPGAPFYLNWRPIRKCVLTGEATISGYITTSTITPAVRVAFGVGFNF